MTQTVESIKWSQIEAEAKPFREALVAVFRKHEGAFVLDEGGEFLRDGQGRRVKVTQRSFARHMGIDEKTFHRWCRGERTPRNEAPATSKLKKQPAERAPKPPKDEGQAEGPAGEHSEDHLPKLLTTPSADELAASVRMELNEIDASRLSSLGWKYLDAAQERLAVIYDAHPDVTHARVR